MTEKKPKSKIYDSKVFWAIISLILSFGIWFYISNTEGSSIDRTYTGIEVQFLGEEELLSQKGLIISNVQTQSVSVRLKGSRSNIGKLSASDIKAVIDVSKITQPNDMVWTYELKFPSGIDKSDITIVSRNPDTISFTVVRNISKTVPVKGSFDGTIAEGCIADEIVFDPAVITVEGPESIVDSIDHAWISFGEYVELDATYSVESTFTLIDVNGDPVSRSALTLSVENVNATQPILKEKELPLVINLVAGGGLSETDCIVTIEPSAMIKVVGDSRLVDDKTSIVLGSVYLSELNDSYEQTYFVETGDGIENTSGITEVNVKIQMPETFKRTVTATNISCKNCSSGYSAQINSPSVDIVLRSTDEDALNAVKPDDITVIVDLTDYGSTTGQIRANASVAVAGFGNVGAIGDVKVVLTIQKE